MRTPKLMDCEAVVRELWDWLDGELPADRWDDIRAHLATCEGCSEHVAFARSFLQQVGAPADDGDLAALRDRVRGALRAAPRD